MLLNSTLSNNSQTQNVNKQLREVTELLNSYQQKISLLNEEIDLVKQQVLSKDKELEQYRIQLKNLKRSRSTDSSSSSQRRAQQASTSTSDPNNSILTGKSSSSSSIEKVSIHQGDTEIEITKKTSTTTKMSLSSDNLTASGGQQQSDATLSRQLEGANDEIRLLRNKIARLEDDLSTVTQVKSIFHF